MERRRKKAGKATSESYSELVHDIGQLMLKAQRLAEEHGLFLDHRELMKCRRCGLMEDVTCEGKLIVYRTGSDEEDTGLRFPEPDEDCVSSCPGCGGLVKLVEDNNNELSCP